MIDIHNHILPGVDDGAKTEEDSLAMAKAAVEQGIHTIIATPHHKNGHYDNEKASILKQVDILRQLFSKENVPLTLLPGQETRIYGDMLEDLKKGELLTLNNTRYIHVELPFRNVPKYTGKLLFDMQVAGYTPIIVHPERNDELVQHPEKLYEFVTQGVLTQVTADAVIGRFGKQSQRFTHQLINANLTHFIASDAHNTTTRGFRLAEAHQTVKEIFGNELFYLFLENGQLLVEDKHVNKLEPQRIKKKKFLGLF